jgi:hypothetical protein
MQHATLHCGDVVCSISRGKPYGGAGLEDSVKSCVVVSRSEICSAVLSAPPGRRNTRTQRLSDTCQKSRILNKTAVKNASLTK